MEKYAGIYPPEYNMLKFFSEVISRGVESKKLLLLYIIF
jgi:hypothetical protein